MKIISSRPRFLALLALACACMHSRMVAAEAAATAGNPADPGLWTSLKAFDYGTSQEALQNLDLAISAAGTNAAELKDLEQHLLALITDASAPLAARQAACQRLGAVLPANPAASEPAVAALAPLLLDEQQCDLARLALDLVPGDNVDAVYLRALGQARGRAQIAIVQSLGFRRAAAAVKPLAPLASDANPQLAAAAIAALGRIGTAGALQALQALPNQGSAPLATAKLAAASRVNGREADAVLVALRDETQLPSQLRAAAFNAMLERQPGAAVSPIVAALSGDEWNMKQAAIAAVAVLPAKDVVPALTGKLSTWDAPTQTAVIAALGRKGDASAVPAITAALHHADAGVRQSALAALAALPGNAETASALAQVAATSSVDDAKLAKASLVRLNGPGVDSAVLAGAEKGEPAIRAVFLETLAGRNMTEALPLLLHTRSDPDATVRSAALSSLGELAPASEQRALLDWAMAASDSTEQSRAVRALTSVTQRNPDRDGRVQPILDAIDHADATTSTRLLPVLSRLETPACAECAGRLALRDDDALADAAVRTLSQWSGSVALAPLVNVADHSTRESVRAAAVKAAVRSLDRARDISSATLAGDVSRLLPAAPDAATKKRLVDFLRRGNDDSAQALAQKLSDDPVVGDSAREAADAIRVNHAAKPRLHASTADYQARNMLDGKTESRWSAPVTAGQWIEIDFGQPRPIRRVTLDESGKTGDFPEKYEVFVTDDRSAPGEAKVTGKGERNRTTIELPEHARGRYVIIKNVADRKEGTWTVSELLID